MNFHFILFTYIKFNLEDIDEASLYEAVYFFYVTVVLLPSLYQFTEFFDYMHYV